MTSYSIKEIIQGGGSGTGMSHYLKRAECPLKQIHNEQAKADGDYGITENMAVGSIFHKIAELYHTGDDTSRVPNIVDGELVLSSWATEARRLFDFYASYTPVNGWGRVVSAEELMETTVPGTDIPLTGRTDLLTEVEPGSELATIYNGPGEYILDYKTHKQKPQDVAVRDQMSLQYVNYMWQRFLKTGKWVRGTLVHHLVRHAKLERNKSELTTLILPPSEHDLEKLFTFVKYSAALPTGFANLSQCTPITGPCRHLTSGRCDQLSKGV